MESIETILLDALIDKCKNEKTQKGLNAALSIVENSGYLNMDDLEQMSEEEIYQEALDLCELNKEEME